VTLLSPGGSTIPVTVTDLTGVTGAHNRWEVDFTPQTAQGTYMLTVVPSLLDLGNHLMDQNENGIFGEVPGDDFIQPFVIGAPSVPVSTGGGGGGTTTTPSGPITGLDITGLVQIVPGRIRKRKNGRLRQTVQIFNTSNQAIQGPFFLIVDGLPRKIHLLSALGFTGTAHGPSGHPFMEVVFSANQLNSLQGGTGQGDGHAPHKVAGPLGNPAHQGRRGDVAQPVHQEQVDGHGGGADLRIADVGQDGVGRADVHEGQGQPEQQAGDDDREPGAQ
jgi:hypothetical protein